MVEATHIEKWTQHQQQGYSSFILKVVQQQTKSGSLKLSRSVGNFDKIWSTCRQHEIQYSE